MKFHFCTITTLDHLPWVKVLHYSLKNQSDSFCLHVLLIDSNNFSNDDETLQFYSIKPLLASSTARKIYDKYGHDMDKIRWGFKSIFLYHLLQKTGTVIYIDNDVFFFAPYEFIFDSLSKNSFLLTPHWAPVYPLPYTTDFELNFKLGLYNAGFIGVTKKALPYLEWWSQLCYYKMEKDFSNGYFDDQRYLDLLPVVDSSTAILRHPGCNVAGWNIHQNKRSMKDREVFINDLYPIVFIHFNNSTLEQIHQGSDPLLAPYLEKYKNAFSLLGYSFDELKQQVFNTSAKSLITIKRKLRFRTRIKNILLKMYQKL